MSLIMRILDSVHRRLHQQLDGDLTMVSFDEWTATTTSGEPE